MYSIYGRIRKAATKGIHLLNAAMATATTSTLTSRKESWNSWNIHWNGMSERCIPYRRQYNLRNMHGRWSRRDSIIASSVYRSCLKTAKKTRTGPDQTKKDRKIIGPGRTATAVWSPVLQIY